ncbi:hypothetical protein TNCV_3932671 [Trichonephila clavipes]|nr:hypothetical protein TNCV_3932671 [Trichonephila clavipes]
MERSSSRSAASKPPPGICTMEVETQSYRKCAGTSYMNHLFWCEWPVFPVVLLGEVGNLHTSRFLKPYQRGWESLHSFCNAPCLAHCLPDVYYCRDVHQMNVI